MSDKFTDDDGELRDWDEVIEANEVDLEPLDVGDHVSIRDDEDSPTLVVLETPLNETAATYAVDGMPLLEFEANADVPRDDDVAVCKFVKRTDLRLSDGKGYAYPRSRLEVEARVHSDRDADESEVEQ